jgi:histidine ammonia-lyase
MTNPVHIDGESLAVEDVWNVGVGGRQVQLVEAARNRVDACQAALHKLIAAGETIYGVTTGIGELARVRVSPEFGSELQHRIIRSHAAGTGDLFPDEEVRAAMLLRINSLAKGFSGVRLETLQTVVEMLNRGVVPLVPEKGSLGTSGDLAPLAHIAEVVIGEGRARLNGQVLGGGEAMARAGLSPMKLTYKEGLGLINGSQVMTAGAALILYRIERLVKSAILASAMTLDALAARPEAFDERAHRARPYNGQNVVAANLRRLMQDSEIIAGGSSKVQDGYSLRCTPQVIGPAVDAYFYARDQVEIEMNSASDNPLFFPEDGSHVAAGNFHGQSVALVLDFLGIAVAELANLSERHTNRLLDPSLSGLPDFLVEGKGLNSGYMIPQYTQAALVSENKVLAHPASVDSIPVSADQEDHVSMGPIGLRKLKEIVRNTETVIAIEMMAAAQALDFRRPLRPGRAVDEAHLEIRRHVPHLEDDRSMHPDIETMRRLVRDFVVLDHVERACGPLTLKADVAVPRAVFEDRRRQSSQACVCDAPMDEQVFKVGGFEVRGALCTSCGRIALNDQDLSRYLDHKFRPRKGPVH